VIRGGDRSHQFERSGSNGCHRRVTQTVVCVAGCRPDRYQPKSRQAASQLLTFNATLGIPVSVNRYHRPTSLKGARMFPIKAPARWPSTAIRLNASLALSGFGSGAVEKPQARIGRCDHRGQWLP
jgi:hypothetical protein